MLQRVTYSDRKRVRAMATKDEKGFIHYTQAELNRIPPFEQRDRAATTPAASTGGALGMVGGALVGAGVGSAFGPAGTVIGGGAGAVAGSAAGGTLAGGEAADPRGRTRS